MSTRRSEKERPKDKGSALPAAPEGASGSGRGAAQNTDEGSASGADRHRRTASVGELESPLTTCDGTVSLPLEHGHGDGADRDESRGDSECKTGSGEVAGIFDDSAVRAALGTSIETSFSEVPVAVVVCNLVDGWIMQAKEAEFVVVLCHNQQLLLQRLCTALRCKDLARYPESAFSSLAKLASWTLGLTKSCKGDDLRHAVRMNVQAGMDALLGRWDPITPLNVAAVIREWTLSGMFSGASSLPMAPSASSAAPLEEALALADPSLLSAAHFGVSPSAFSDFISSMLGPDEGGDLDVRFVGNSHIRAIAWLDDYVFRSGMGTVVLRDEETAELGALIGVSGAGKSSVIIRAAEQGLFSLAPIYIRVADHESIALTWTELQKKWDALGSTSNDDYAAALYLLLGAYLDWLTEILTAPRLPRIPRAFGSVLARFSVSPTSSSAVAVRFGTFVKAEVVGSLDFVRERFLRLQRLAVEYGRSDARFFFAFDEVASLMSGGRFTGNDGTVRSDLYGLVYVCHRLKGSVGRSVLLGSSLAGVKEWKMWSCARSTKAVASFSSFDPFPPARVFQALVANGVTAIVRHEAVFELRGRPLWVAGVIRGARVRRPEAVLVDQVRERALELSESMRNDFKASVEARRFVADVLFVAMLGSGTGDFNGSPMSATIPPPSQDALIRLSSSVSSISGAAGEPPHSTSSEVGSPGEPDPLDGPVSMTAGASSSSAASAASPYEALRPPAPRGLTSAEFAVYRGYLSTSTPNAGVFSVLGDGILMKACDLVATDVAQESPDEDVVFQNLATRIERAKAAANKMFELAVSWVFCRLGRVRERPRDPDEDADEGWGRGRRRGGAGAAGCAGAGAGAAGCAGAGAGAVGGAGAPPTPAQTPPADPCLRTFGGAHPFFAPLCKTTLRFDKFVKGEMSRGEAQVFAAYRDVDEECLRTEFHLLFRRDEEGKRVPATDFAVTYTRDGTSGPDVLFWARDRAGKTRLVFVQAKSGEAKLGPSFKTLDPARMFPKEDVHQAAFRDLLRDSEVLHFFRNPVRVLFTAYAIPEEIQVGMARWNKAHSSQPVFAFQGSAATMGSALWGHYSAQAVHRVPIPKAGCSDFQLWTWGTRIVPRESIAPIAPVVSLVFGDVIPGRQAARFAQGVLGRLVPERDLQAVFNVAEAVAFRRWPRSPPREDADLASFFTAATEAFRHAFPGEPPVTAESVEAALGRAGQVVVNDKVIEDVAMARDVQIRVIEDDTERCFPRTWVGKRGVITLYRSWCHFSATPFELESAAETSTSAPGAP